MLVDFFCVTVKKAFSVGIKYASSKGKGHPERFLHDKENQTVYRITGSSRRSKEYPYLAKLPDCNPGSEKTMPYTILQTGTSKHLTDQENSLLAKEIAEKLAKGEIIQKKCPIDYLAAFQSEERNQESLMHCGFLNELLMKRPNSNILVQPDAKNCIYAFSNIAVTKEQAIAGLEAGIKYNYTIINAGTHKTNNIQIIEFQKETSLLENALKELKENTSLIFSSTPLPEEEERIMLLHKVIDKIEENHSMPPLHMIGSVLSEHHNMDERVAIIRHVSNYNHLSKRLGGIEKQRFNGLSSSSSSLSNPSTLKLTDSSLIYSSSNSIVPYGED